MTDRVPGSAERPGREPAIALDGLAYGIDHLDAIIVFHIGDGHVHASWVAPGSGFRPEEIAGALRDAYRACLGASHSFGAASQRGERAEASGPFITIELPARTAMIRQARAFGVACLFDASMPLGMARLVTGRLASTIEPELPIVSVGVQSSSPAAAPPVMVTLASPLASMPFASTTLASTTLASPAGSIASSAAPVPLASPAATMPIASPAATMPLPSASALASPMAASLASPMAASLASPMVASLLPSIPSPLASSVPAPISPSIPSPLASSVPSPIAPSIPSPLASSVPPPLAPSIQSPMASSLPLPTLSSSPPPPPEAQIHEHRAAHPEGERDLPPRTLDFPSTGVAIVQKTPPDLAPGSQDAEIERVRRVLQYVHENVPEPHVALLRVALRAGVAPLALERLDSLAATKIVLIEAAASEILGVDLEGFGRLQ